MILCSPLDRDSDNSTALNVESLEIDLIRVLTVQNRIRDEVEGFTLQKCLVGG
jgi:hypothetical protein